MVFRKYIRCLTCDATSTLRVSPGHNPYQKHDFMCPSCDEPIGVGLEVDLINATADFEFYENCEESDEEGKVINLNPHFLVPEESANTDGIFPWMEQVVYIQGYSKVEAIILEDDPIQIQGMPIHMDVYTTIGGLNNVTEIWNSIKKGWSLKNNKKHALSLRQLKKYSPPKFTGSKNLNNVIRDFSYRMILPKMYIYLDQTDLAIEKAKKTNEEEFNRFIEFYKQSLHEEHFKRYLTTYSEYFDNYSEYDQAILYTKNMTPVPEGCIATSHGFNNTKMFYGNAYENYTTNISILACLNNIICGRKFDEFQNMDLNQYLTINKANRGKPFSQNTLLKDFLSCTDSTLRNASHHQSIELIDKGRNVSFRSGGTGQVQVISYSKYIEKCNSLMLFSAALLQLEIKFLEHTE